LTKRLAKRLPPIDHEPRQNEKSRKDGQDEGNHGLTGREAIPRKQYPQHHNADCCADKVEGSERTKDRRNRRSLGRAPNGPRLSIGADGPMIVECGSSGF
jgi:hypothetical protein